MKHYQRQDPRAKCLVASVVPSRGNMEARGAGGDKATSYHTGHCCVNTETQHVTGPRMGWIMWLVGLEKNKGRQVLQFHPSLDPI